MSYLNYVIASYAIFVLVLGWEFLASRLQIGRELRNARRRAARQSSRPAASHSPSSNPCASESESKSPNPNELTR